MSYWYDEARKRLEQKQQQQQQQEEQNRLLELQQQKQIYNELLRIVYAVGAVERLKYIIENKWGCGQIKSFRRIVSRNDMIYTFPESKRFFEAGRQLHFEYELLKFEVGGGYDRDSETWSPEYKILNHSTETIAVTISAVQLEDNGSGHLFFAGKPLEDNGSGHLFFAGKPLSTPLKDLAALVEELDEAIYLYCETARSPLETQAWQNKRNQEEKKAYRRYKPRKYPSW